MTTLSLVLLSLGIVLLLVEACFPGFGVCGITGLALFVVSAIIMVIFMPFGIFIVMGELVLLIGAGTAAFKYIKKKQFYGKIILDETLDMESRDIGDPEFLLGKEGITKTPLRPFGLVDFNGTALEVSSDGSYIPGGMPVKVIEVSKHKILVRSVATKMQ